MLKDRPSSTFKGRSIQTPLGDVSVRQPRVRDHRAPVEREVLTSKILPPYLRKTRSLKELIPSEFQERLSKFSSDARAVVSEPLTDLPEPWEEVPESSFLTVEAGEIERRPFAPQSP